MLLKSYLRLPQSNPGEVGCSSECGHWQSERPQYQLWRLMFSFPFLDNRVGPCSVEFKPRDVHSCNSINSSRWVHLGGSFLSIIITSRAAFSITQLSPSLPSNLILYKHIGGSVQLVVVVALWGICLAVAVESDWRSPKISFPRIGIDPHFKQSPIQLIRPSFSQSHVWMSSRAQMELQVAAISASFGYQRYIQYWSRCISMKSTRVRWPSGLVISSLSPPSIWS